MPAYSELQERSLVALAYSTAVTSVFKFGRLPGSCPQMLPQRRAGNVSSWTPGSQVRWHGMCKYWALLHMCVTGTGVTLSVQV